MSGEYADAVARITRTLASYAHALDDGRTDDAVAAFLPDGVSVLPGYGAIQGHDALRSAYASMKPTAPQRHVVSNIEVTDLDGSSATVLSDLVVLGKRDGRWAVLFVGRYADRLRAEGEAWLFESRDLTLE